MVLIEIGVLCWSFCSGSPYSILGGLSGTVDPKSPFSVAPASNLSIWEVRQWDPLLETSLATGREAWLNNNKNSPADCGHRSQTV